MAFGAAIIPMAVIMRGMKSGKVQSGHHVTTRTERLVPLGIAVVSVGAVLGVLWLADAPHEITAVTTVMLVTVAVCLAITRVWKISLHAAVSAGSAVVLNAVYGWITLPIWIAVVAVCWSRIRLNDHTAAQVLTGSAVGAGAGLLFLLMS